MPNPATPHSQSQLFTVRIWTEVSAQRVMTWRGKVQSVPDGAWRYFHEWATLAQFLQNQVEELAGTGSLHPLLTPNNQLDEH
jgi:hypothetical protein